MVEVEQWAEIRRLHFVHGLSMREIHRRTGLHRDTVSQAIHSDAPPAYRRASAGSKLDPFKAQIARLLRDDPDLPGARIGELLEPAGWDGGKTILDDYLREVRPLFAAARTTQRTIYRPSEICQFDVWQPKREVPVGHGQTRPGWVVVACLGYSRAVPARWCSASRRRICWPVSGAVRGSSAGLRRRWSTIRPALTAESRGVEGETPGGCGSL